MNNLDSHIEFLKLLQDQICDALMQLDGKAAFIEDNWHRAEGGGGRSRVITDGNVIEKGGVMFSHVNGALPDFLKQQCPNASFFDATGISIVLHAKNPFVPIIHMNIRYFLTDDGNYWYGGGVDVSPAYPDFDQAAWFHTHLYSGLNAIHTAFYAKFKPWCDTYFTIKHRNEMRGIGGVFFDHLTENEAYSLSQIQALWKFIGNEFMPIYTYFVHQNQNKPFDNQHLLWQQIRRGRYVEFNLVYDKGTHFGLQTNGRIESILVSMPPLASWVYNYVPASGSLEQQAAELFQPKDWVSLCSLETL